MQSNGTYPGGNSHGSMPSSAVPQQQGPGATATSPQSQQQAQHWARWQQHQQQMLAQQQHQQALIRAHQQQQEYQRQQQFAQQHPGVAQLPLQPAGTFPPHGAPGGGMPPHGGQQFPPGGQQHGGMQSGPHTMPLNFPHHGGYAQNNPNTMGGATFDHTSSTGNSLQHPQFVKAQTEPALNPYNQYNMGFPYGASGETPTGFPYGASGETPTNMQYVGQQPSSMQQQQSLPPTASAPSSGPVQGGFAQSGGAVPALAESSRQQPNPSVLSTPADGVMSPSSSQATNRAADGFGGSGRKARKSIKKEEPRPADSRVVEKIGEGQRPESLILTPSPRRLGRTFNGKTDQNDLVGLLMTADVPLLRDLDEAAREKLSESFSFRRIGPHEYVYRQDERGDALYFVLSGHAHMLRTALNYLNVGDRVRLERAVHFGGTKVKAGSLGVIDKFDPGRDFPYTVRLLDDYDFAHTEGRGRRGRVLQSEIEVVDKKIPCFYVNSLGPGDYFGEEAWRGGGSHRECTVVSCGVEDPNLFAADGVSAAEDADLGEGGDGGKTTWTSAPAGVTSGVLSAPGGCGQGGVGAPPLEPIPESSASSTLNESFYTKQERSASPQSNKQGATSSGGASGTPADGTNDAGPPRADGATPSGEDPPPSIEDGAAAAKGPELLVAFINKRKFDSLGLNISFPFGASRKAVMCNADLDKSVHSSGGASEGLFGSTVKRSMDGRRDRPTKKNLSKDRPPSHEGEQQYSVSSDTSDHGAKNSDSRRKAKEVVVRTGVKNGEIEEPYWADARSALAQRLYQNSTLRHIAPLSFEQAEHLAKVAELHQWRNDAVIERFICDAAQVNAENFYKKDANTFAHHLQESEADRMLIMKRGDCSLTLPNDAPPHAHQAFQMGLVRAQKTGTFGELSMLFHLPPIGTLRVTSEEAQLWVIRRQDFKRVLLQWENSRINQIVRLFEYTSEFRSLLNYERLALAEATTERSFPQQTEIISNGTEVGHLFFLVKGEVEISGVQLKQTTLKADGIPTIETLVRLLENTEEEENRREALLGDEPDLGSTRNQRTNGSSSVAAVSTTVPEDDDGQLTPHRGGTTGGSSMVVVPNSRSRSLSTVRQSQLEERPRGSTPVPREEVCATPGASPRGTGGRAGGADSVKSSGGGRPTSPGGGRPTSPARREARFLSDDSNLIAGLSQRWFGERPVLREQERSTYTVIVKSETATCLTIPRHIVKRYLAPAGEDALLDGGVNIRKTVKPPESSKSKKGEKKETELERKKRQKDEEQERLRINKLAAERMNTPSCSSKVYPKKQIDIRLSDLKCIGYLGVGGFGSVTLQLDRRTQETYALKSISKGYIMKRKMQKGVLREKEILFMCDSTFIVKAFATIKDDNFLYFLLEPCLGGELFATYHRFRFHGSITKARFYSASVVTAFDYLHKKNVLYRDLKPENLLLDARGFCKLTDMGLAKVLRNGKTYTTCGTPDYFAPEVVQHQGQTLSVDWWALGVLIHELLTGHAPFEAHDTMATVQKILKGTSRVDFSSYSARDPDAVELVCGLLQADPAKRLPLLPGKTPLGNLLDAPWYRNFPWSDLWSHKVKAPFMPRVADKKDRSNFKEPKKKNQHFYPYQDPGTGWDKDF